MFLRTAIATTLLSLSAASASAQGAGIVGSWRGTSTCVNLQHSPNCKNEQVIYDARPFHASRDTVVLKADKVVNGVRETMSEDNFVRQADGTWMADLRPRFRVMIILTVSGDTMTGALMDPDSKTKVRDMALKRTP